MFSLILYQNLARWVLYLGLQATEMSNNLPKVTQLVHQRA